ncbi:MAG TPA: molybdopterin-binding protein, partial [Holophaga sp.]|nr:molybdopterin-binding protein [Holophaga sp.]
LMRTLRAEQFFGRKARLLAALARVPGVRLAPDADIHSAGILVSIGLDEGQAREVIAESRAMGQAIAGARRARVRVYPTGFELIEGVIEDTNTPYLLKVFSEAGFVPEAGGAVPDSPDALVEALGRAAATCGVVVTTGGVGAEDKDFSVEAIETLDPEAATPYLTRFAKGHGRHVKDGVRLGVGLFRDCLMVALPGPHDEVRLAAPVLLRGLKQGLSKRELARTLAECLRGKWRGVGQGHAGGDTHEHDGTVRS